MRVVSLCFPTSGLPHRAEFEPGRDRLPTAESSSAVPASPLLAIRKNIFDLVLSSYNDYKIVGLIHISLIELQEQVGISQS